MFWKQLDQTEDIDDRKAIRGRIQELRSIERGEAMFEFSIFISICQMFAAKRDEKLARLTNTREDMLQERQKKAAEQKQRTLAMYDRWQGRHQLEGRKRWTSASIRLARVSIFEVFGSQVVTCCMHLL